MEGMACSGPGWESDSAEVGGFEVSSQEATPVYLSKQTDSRLMVGNQVGQAVTGQNLVKEERILGVTVQGAAGGSPAVHLSSCSAFCGPCHSGHRVCVAR